MNKPFSGRGPLTNAAGDAAGVDVLAGESRLPASPLAALVATKKQAFERLAKHLDLLEPARPTPNGMRRLPGRVWASLSTPLAKLASRCEALRPASKGPGDLQ